jgi:pseudouridine-5'-phosphate glycosidase
MLTNNIRSSIEVQVARDNNPPAVTSESNFIANGTPYQINLETVMKHLVG